MLIIGIVIGIVLAQGIVFLTALFTNENLDAICWASCFLFIIPQIILEKIIKKNRKKS